MKEPCASAIDIDNRIAEQPDTKEQLEQLKAIVEAVPAFVSYVGTDLRYRIISKHYEAYFGRTRDEILGHAMCEVLGGAAWAQIEQYMTSALKGIPAQFEVYTEVPNRGMRWSQGSFIPHRGENGAVSGVIIFAYDITEQKRYERESRDQVAFYRSIFESHGVMKVGSLR